MTVGRRYLSFEELVGLTQTGDGVCGGVDVLVAVEVTESTIQLAKQRGELTGNRCEGPSDPPATNNFPFIGG